MSVDKYLGKRYCPQKYNCAHLVSEVWHDITGQDISTALQGFLGPRKDRRVVLADLRTFKRLQTPSSPCIVLFQSPREASHVGIYLRGRVLHIKSKGVTFELLETASICFKKVGFFSC